MDLVLHLAWFWNDLIYVLLNARQRHKLLWLIYYSICLNSLNLWLVIVDEQELKDEHITIQVTDIYLRLLRRIIAFFSFFLIQDSHYFCFILWALFDYIWENLDSLCTLRVVDILLSDLPETSYDAFPILIRELLDFTPACHIAKVLQEKLSHACIEVTIMNTSLNHFEDLGEGIRILVNGTGEKLTITQLTGV